MYSNTAIVGIETMELKLGEPVLIQTLPAARRAGKYDQLIQNAERTLKEGQAIPIQGIPKEKLANVNLAIRSRIIRLKAKVHVQKAGDTLYLVYGAPERYIGKPRGPKPKK